MKRAMGVGGGGRHNAFALMVQSGLSSPVIHSVRNQLPALAEVCKRHGVVRLFLVGSAASDTFDESRSDLDFLVVFPRHPTPGQEEAYFQLHDDLKQLFLREIDLIEARCVKNPYMIASLNRTKRMVYAA